MQWNSGKNAGFSEGHAWLKVNENCKDINVESEEADDDSILNYYRKLVNLRKVYNIISEGSIKFLDSGNEKVFAYERRLNDQRLVVLCNFSGNDEKISGVDIKGKVLIGNYSGSHKIMRPYEALVILEG